MSNTGCVSLNLPFGMAVSGSAVANPGITFDPMRQLLGNLNSVLTPFMPIFKIVGFAKDVTDCLKAIPDCIAQLSPKPLISKLAKVVQDIDELLGVLPQTSVPVMLRDLIGALVTYLRGIQSQILGLQVHASVIANLSATANTYQSSNPDAYEELNGIVVAAMADGASYIGTLDAQSCAFNELCRTFKIVADLLGLPAPPILACFNFDATLDASAYNKALKLAADGLEAAIDVLLGIGAILGGVSTPAPPC